MPYREPARGDIVVFLYPEDIRETYIKRVIGVPGDHIHLDNKRVIRNGKRLIEPYTQHIAVYPDPYRDNFPLAPEAETTPRGRDMFERYVRNGEVIVPPDALFVMGDNRIRGQPILGIRAAQLCHRQAALHLLVLRCATADLKDWSIDHVVDVFKRLHPHPLATHLHRAALPAAREVGETQ